MAVLTPPSALVTTTVKGPTDLTGAVQVMEVSLTKLTLVARSPPISTVAPETNKVPVMVRVSVPARLLV